jgi:hypothetical protein
MAHPPIFDGDTHLYEQPDAFSRYLPERYKARAVRMETTPDGRVTLFAGDRKMTISDSAMAEGGLVPRPGSLKEFLRKVRSAEGANGADIWVPMAEEFQYREARLRRLDQQGVEAAILFAGHAITSEPFIDDTDVLYAQQHAYNQWLNEEWGWDFENRLYAPALLTSVTWTGPSPRSTG